MDKFPFEDVWGRVVILTGWESQTQLADFLGFSASSVSGAKKRGFFPIEWAYKIANKHNAFTDWLLTGKDPIYKGEVDKRAGREENAPGAPGVVTYEDETEPAQQPHIDIPQWPHPDAVSFHYVPMATAKLCAGGGMFVLSEDVSDYYAFRKNWLKRISTSPKNVVLMEVQGNSMAPTILDKDTVMIDTGRLEIIEGMIYAIRLDQTIMIKRLTHRPGGIINVISDNKEEFETYQANRKDVHIIGQIIFFSRDLISGY